MNEHNRGVFSNESDRIKMIFRGYSVPFNNGSYRQRQTGISHRLCVYNLSTEFKFYSKNCYLVVLLRFLTTV